MTTKKTTRAKPKLVKVRPAGTVRHEVEIDEPKERLGNVAKEFALDSLEGPDPLAEALGEEFIENATGVDDAATVLTEAPRVEERGGPFVITTGRTEFASGTDASNPPDALREPLPKVL